MKANNWSRGERGKGENEERWGRDARTRPLGLRARQEKGTEPLVQEKKGKRKRLRKGGASGEDNSDRMFTLRFCAFIWRGVKCGL